MAKWKQLSTNDLPPKSKGRFNFDLDSAPTGKGLCYQIATVQPSLSAQSVPGFSGLTIIRSSSLDYQSYPKWQMQQFLTTVIWHCPSWASQLAVTLLLFLGTQCCVCVLCLPAALVHSLLAIYERWGGNIGCSPALKPYMEVLGGLRWLLPVVTLLPAVRLPLMYDVIMW